MKTLGEGFSHTEFIRLYGSSGARSTPKLRSKRLRRNHKTDVHCLLTCDSVPVRIELVRPSHHDDQRTQRMQHFDGRTLRLEHVRQAAIDVRALVGAAAAQRYALLLDPLVH